MADSSHNASGSIDIGDVLVRIRASAKPFQLEFEKRTTGQLRLIRCVYNPPDGAFDDSPKTKEAVDLIANRLINIYDLDDSRFKSIPIEGIRRVEFDGQWVNVVQRQSDAEVSESAS